MREIRCVLIGATTALIVLIAPRSLLSEKPSTDTVRAGRCSTAAIDQPDSTAQWVRVAKQWSHETPGAWSNDSLRNVVLALGKADQDARSGITAERMKDSAYARGLMRGDSVRSAQMGVVLDRFGWPGKSMVGVDGETAAFHIIQHSATLGPTGLALMLAAKPGEASPADVALVTDRQRMYAGHPQIYGSQLDLQHGDALHFFAIEDRARIDERRAAMGLPPLRPYACMIATMYRAPVVMPDSGHK